MFLFFFTVLEFYITSHICMLCNLFHNLVMRLIFMTCFYCLSILLTFNGDCKNSLNCTFPVWHYTLVLGVCFGIRRFNSECRSVIIAVLQLFISFVPNYSWLWITTCRAVKYRRSLVFSFVSYDQRYVFREIWLWWLETCVLKIIASLT